MQHDEIQMSDAIMDIEYAPSPERSMLAICLKRNDKLSLLLQHKVSFFFFFFIWFDLIWFEKKKISNILFLYCFCNIKKQLIELPTPLQRIDKIGFSKYSNVCIAQDERNNKITLIDFDSQ